MFSSTSMQMYLVGDKWAWLSWSNQPVLVFSIRQLHDLNSFFTLARYNILAYTTGILDSMWKTWHSCLWPLVEQDLTEVIAIYLAFWTTQVVPAPLWEERGWRTKKADLQGTCFWEVWGRWGVGVGKGVRVRARECFCGSLKAGIPRFLAPS